MQLVMVLYYILVFSWILPSGSVLGVPVKTVLFLLTAIAFVICIIAKRMPFKVSLGIKILIPVILLLLIWTVISYLNGFDETIKNELKSFVSLLSVIVITDLLYTNGFFKDRLNQLKVLIYASVILFVVVRVAAEILYCIGVMPEAYAFFICNDVLDSELLTLSMDLGPFNYCRFTLPNDQIPLILLAFDMVSRKRKIPTRIVMIVLSAAYVMIVYSRIIIVQFALVLLLSFIIANIRYKKTTFIKVLWIIVVVIVAGACVLVFVGGATSNGMLSNIRQMIVSRFTSTADASDSIRTDQEKYLTEGIKESPLIGHGLGSYVLEYTRSDIAKETYELQYLSFVFQFGIVGFILTIIGMIVSFFTMVLKASTNKIVVVATLFCFAMWAVKPFFNPQFLTSTSGMVIVMIYLCALIMSKEKDIENWNMKKEKEKLNG